MLLIHPGCPLQQAAVQIEHIARIRLPAGRTAQQKRHLAICPGVLGEVIVGDEGVPALLHEILTYSAPGIWSDVLKRRRIGGIGHYHHRVGHGTVLFQGCHHLSDFARLLSDGNVNTDQVLPLLIDESIEDYGGLARGAVAYYQLALAPTNGDHGVNCFDTRLDRCTHRLSDHHVGSDALHRPHLLNLYGAFSVQRTSQRVNHPTQEPFAHRHAYNLACGFDLIALFDMSAIAHDGDAYGVLLQVQSQPHRTIGELQ